MDAVTYPTEEVVEFVMEHLIPLRNVVDDLTFSDDYHAFWTPTLLILDYDGTEIQRSVGFFAPDDFIAMLLLGMAKFRFIHEEFDGAQFCLTRLLERYPKNVIIPEAIFYQGVILYKMKKSPVELKKAYEKLCAEYPDSAWARRAAPYRLI